MSNSDNNPITDSQSDHTDTDALRHSKKMANRKRVQDSKAANRQIEKGLLIINTGKGKGKSSAAFGMALRALSHGGKVAVIQYIKGAWQTGERRFFEQAAQQMNTAITFEAMGEGFTWDTADKARDIAAANKAWERSCQLLQDDSISLVILDELNIALRYDYLDVNAVVTALQARPPQQHVVITGRNAKAELIEIADTVSSIEPVKHHSADGVKAQAGVEY